MRTFITMLTALLLLLTLSAGPAAAMQPPGEPAQDHFGCLDGEDNAVGGHPGAPGIVDATHRVKALTGDPTPTAWNAVEHAARIDLGSC